MDDGALARFRQLYPFGLDPFQEPRLREHRLPVVGCSWRRRPAPARPWSPRSRSTGRWSGRTKCFYTTPLKALSNQKFGDLVAKHGAGTVGLLTGDNSINPDASVVVMTTEVLRNMLYERSSTLHRIALAVVGWMRFTTCRTRIAAPSGRRC